VITEGAVLMTVPRASFRSSSQVRNEPRESPSQPRR
jgi:hypothetical protein